MKVSKDNLLEFLTEDNAKRYQIITMKKHEILMKEEAGWGGRACVAVKSFDFVVRFVSRVQQASNTII